MKLQRKHIFTSLFSIAFVALAGAVVATYAFTGPDANCATPGSCTTKYIDGTRIIPGTLPPSAFTSVGTADAGRGVSIKKIAFSPYHSQWLLTDDGRVKALGWNSNWALGIGGLNSTSRGYAQNVPIDDVKYLADGGNYHNCVIKRDNSLWCWGYNNWGEVGVGPNDSVAVFTPRKIMDDVKEVFIGGNAGTNHYTCAIKLDKTVWCWGQNGYGHLGVGDTNNRFGPSQVKNLTDVEKLILSNEGTAHTCAIKSDKTVWCWGYNGNGQLGNRNTTNQSEPVKVSGINNAVKVQIAGDSGTTCALLEDKTMKCWGYNGYGQLGEGTFTSNSAPQSVNNLSDVEDFTMGGGSYVTACAILKDRTVRCWGYNGYGQLGNDSTVNSSTPVPVKNLSGVSKVYMSGTGSYTTVCALLNDKAVKCWGYGGNGQVGDGLSNATNKLPIQVPGLENVKSLTMSGYSSTGWTCALLTNGKVMCWGYNGNYQQGVGHTALPTNNLVPGYMYGLHFD